MKAHTILFVCSVLASSCRAQEDLGDYARLNTTDSLGRKQGLWVERFDDGTTKAVMHYKDNALDGVSVWFSSEGKLQTYATFVNGKHHGISRSVEPQDGTVRVTLCDEGVVQLVKVFNTKGILELEEIYKNGEITKSVHHTPTGIIEGHPTRRSGVRARP